VGESPSWGCLLPPWVHHWVGGHPIWVRGVGTQAAHPASPSVPRMAPGFRRDRKLSAATKSWEAPQRGRWKDKAGHASTGALLGSTPPAAGTPTPGSEGSLFWGVTQSGSFLVAASSDWRNIFLAGTEMRKLKVCGWAFFFFLLKAQCRA